MKSRPRLGLGFGEMRGDTVSRQSPLQAFPQSIQTDLAQERHSRAKRRRRERAVRAAAADGFGHGRHRRFTAS